MESQFLTEQQFAAMGLAHADGVALQTWGLQRVGFVLDNGGFGGSGIFVMTRESERALLTARHVIIRSVLAGEVSIGAYDEGRAAFKTARSISFSATCDAALVFAPDELVIPTLLSAEDWDPELAPELDVDARMLAGGLPGLWKGEKDVKNRSIKRARVMLLWSEVVNVSQSEIETLARWDLPQTLRGMSGGPLFTFDRKLAGIHSTELRHRGTDELLAINSLRRSEWADLYRGTDTMEGPDDLQGRQIRWQQRARYDGAPVQVGFEGWYFDSPSDPSHPRGSFGRIALIRILNSEASQWYPINLISNFYFETEETSDAQREATARAHGEELLREMGFIPL